MTTQNQTTIRRALLRLVNVAEFARRHGLPLRTLWRVRGGADARLGTFALIDAALRKHRTREEKA